MKADPKADAAAAPAAGGKSKLFIMIGAAVLGQPLTPRIGVGGAMIVAAVVLLQVRRERVA